MRRVSSSSAQAPSADTNLNSGGESASFGPIRKSYALVVQGQRGQWIGLVGLGVIVSILEAFGAALVFVLLGLITDPDRGIELPLIGNVSHWFPEVDNDELLVGAAVTIGVFFFFRGAFLVVQTYLQQKITHGAGARLSTRLMRGYLSMPYSYHLRHDSAELVRNAISSVQEFLGKMVIPVTAVIAETLVVVGLLVVLFATAPVASFLVIALLGPASYLVLRLVKARVKRYGRVATDSARQSLRILQQSLHGARDVRLLGREAFFVKEFARQRLRDATARARQASFSKLTSVIIDALLMLIIAGFLIVTVRTVGTATESLAVLGLFAYAGMRLKPSVQRMISMTNNLRFATPVIDDLYQDLEETDKAIQLQDSADESSRAVPIMQNSIQLEDVAFYYEGGDHPTLDSVTLEIRFGESIGICGPTGGGKSTLVDIITGLLEPTSGRVLVDGVDIRQNVQTWYEQLGVVSQDMYLFDDTLRRNIALGVPDGEIVQPAVERALHLAQLDDFVATLPRGLDTRVGEHGTLLSGGQRQRVAIARALYREPSVLILDEGTSALDNETEREFISALSRYKGKGTIIMVAHRLTTIKQCDRVIFVNRGRISGSGTYAELYAHNATFRQMAS